MFRTLLLSAALLWSSTGLAAADDLDDKIDQAEELGQEIYNQDIAAWVATDELLVFLGDNSDFDADTLGGWISYRDGRRRYKTVFFSKDTDNPRALFEVESKRRDIKKAKAVDRALDEEELGLWRARSLMLSQEFEACMDYTPYNSVVVEKEGGGYYGYLFAATKEPDLVVLGRHYRFDINAEGSEILGTHAFSKGCYALPFEENSVALMTTHIVSNHPEEHHVFANLMWDKEFYISTGNDDTQVLWKVSKGKISTLDLD